MCAFWATTAIIYKAVVTTPLQDTTFKVRCLIMAWVFPTEMINLCITQYSADSALESDDNQQTYITPDQQTNLESENGSVINNNIDIGRAIIFSAISLILVILGGITSGLNVSLLSIDANKTEIMRKLRSVPQSTLDMIDKIQPLINDRHLLLVTLLVANATCMEALPIFLDELVASWLAIVISVTFVLIFGEILPQAMFTTNPLKTGYRLYYLVIAMKWMLYPICKPLALLLDCILGKEHRNKGVTFTRKEVSMIMSELKGHPDEKLVVEGALKLGTVSDSIIKWKDVTCFNANKKLDALGLLEIFKTGYSRIPIYEGTRDNIIGVLLVKALIFCDPDPELTIKQYLMLNFRKIHAPALVQIDTPLYDCLNIFQVKLCGFQSHVVCI